MIENACVDCGVFGERLKVVEGFGAEGICEEPLETLHQ